MIKNIRFAYYKWKFGFLKIGYNEENYIVLIKIDINKKMSLIILQI